MTFGLTPDPVTLYGVPYAGGNGWAYRRLEPFLPPNVTLKGLELPGRGRRSREPLHVSLEDLADDLFRQVRPDLGSGRYAFFGHSMGALLSYLVTRRAQRAGLPLPDALFLSGSDAPTALTRRQRHRMPKAEFLSMLREMGGSPPDVLADRELLDYFEPVLRADFQAVETWPGGGGTPLDVPISVFIGRDDEVSEASARQWAKETRAPLRFRVFDGNHFFILDAWAQIGSVVGEQLTARTAPVLRLAWES